MVNIDAILSLCLSVYLIGYIVEKRFSGEVGSLIRQIAAGIYVLVVLLRILGVNVG